MSVLEISNLGIRFGGLQALQDLNLTVNEYEIVGLIGPNGAGKTTAFNCITGFYTPDTGTVVYRGEDVTRVPPHKKAAMGFGRTFQNVGMVKSSSVLENLKTAQHAGVRYGALSGLLGGGTSWREERQLEERAMAILDMLGLAELRDTRVGGLSYGTLKLLELGCALATDPDILLLDEPTSGMGPDESEELGDRLLELRREFGLTMLVIEHHVPLVLRVCDHVYVLNFGRLLAEGKPAQIQTHPEVVAAYLGGEAPGALEQTTEDDEDAVLDAQLGEAARAHDDEQRWRPQAAEPVPAEVTDTDPFLTPVAVDDEPEPASVPELVPAAPAPPRRRSRYTATAGAAPAEAPTEVLDLPAVAASSAPPPARARRTRGRTAAAQRADALQGALSRRTESSAAVSQEEVEEA